MDRSGTTSPHKVQCQTRVRTSGRWYGNRVSPSSQWSLLRRCVDFIFLAPLFFPTLSTLPHLFCVTFSPGGEPRKELSVLAPTWITAQHGDIWPLQNHHAVSHRVRLLCHNRSKDQTPPHRTRKDCLASAVHRLA